MVRAMSSLFVKTNLLSCFFPFIRMALAREMGLSVKGQEATRYVLFLADSPGLQKGQGWKAYLQTAVNGTMLEAGCLLSPTL